MAAQSPSQPDAAAAPWFYRKRFTVFGVLYGVAFFFGYLLAGVLGVPLVPAYRAFGEPGLLLVVAIVCAVGGYALRVWASSYLKSTVVWREDPQSPQLRVSGPYRFTRNPLYLGNLLQSLGIGLVFPWTVLVILVPLMLAFNYALIFIEERFLSATQGAAYERYRSSVGRLIPLPWRFAAAGTQPASLRDGLRSEVMIGLLALGVVVLALARR